jgi:hypothetical protein
MEQSKMEEHFPKIQTMAIIIMRREISINFSHILLNSFRRFLSDFNALLQKLNREIFMRHSSEP